MLKTMFVGGALALMLAACSSVMTMDAGRVGEEGYDAARVMRPNPNKPNLFIAEDTATHQVFVDQEPIYLRNVDDRVVIAWALPVAPARYTFDREGIQIVGVASGAPGPVGLRCVPGRKIFSCSYNRPPPGTKYKYTVRVLEDGKPLPALDPYIANN